MTIDQYKKLDLILDYGSPHGAKNKQCKSVIKQDGDIKLLNQQKYRLEFVHSIRNSYNLLRKDEQTFTEHQQSVLANMQVLEETIKTHSNGDAYLTDLLTDLTGQVKQAFSRKDWFSKWGIHYLPSITRMCIIDTSV